MEQQQRKPTGARRKLDIPHLRNLNPVERSEYCKKLQQPYPNATQNSPLLALPKELLDMVWAFTLVEDDIVYISPARPKERYGKPSLLQVCKQTRADAGSIYYSGNRFACLSATIMCRWLKRLEPKVHSKIKDVRIGLNDAPSLSIWPSRLPSLLAEMEYFMRLLDDNFIKIKKDAIRVYWDEIVADPAHTKAELEVDLRICCDEQYIIRLTERLRLRYRALVGPWKRENREGVWCAVPPKPLTRKPRIDLAKGRI